MKIRLRTTPVVALFLGIAGLAASPAFATAAQAQQVTHTSGPIFGSNFAPAGTLCDVAVKTTFTGMVRMTLFGDPNNPTKVIEHDTFNVVHTNLATGEFATEFHVGTAHSIGNATKLTGLFFFHVRNEAGKLVLNGAGLLTFDENGVVKQTPGLHADASLLCPIIGANPLGSATSDVKDAQAEHGLRGGCPVTRSRIVRLWVERTPLDSEWIDGRPPAIDSERIDRHKLIACCSPAYEVIGANAV
jgi:hypothetical protein